MLNKEWPIDKLLLFTILQLVGFGTVMMYSASSHLAETKFDNHLHYFLKHAKWILIGILSYQIFSRIKYQQIKNVIPFFTIMTWFIIILAFYLNPTNKPSRWLIIAGVNWMTTSDLARIMLIIYTSYFIDRYTKELSDYKFMLMKFTPVPMVTLILILLQPDLSSTIIIGAIIFFMLFIAKTCYKYLLILIFSALIIFSYKITTTNYMANRLSTWIFSHSNQHEQIMDNQQEKALMALGSGGWIGKGLGNSTLKEGYLPAAHTDYILPIIGEEYGFYGIAYLFFIFISIFHLGIQVVKITPDRFSMFLSLGIVINIIFYFLINVAYVLGYAPNTGLSLPFISYGGSNTIFTLIGIGLLINISRKSINSNRAL